MVLVIQRTTWCLIYTFFQKVRLFSSLFDFPPWRRPLLSALHLSNFATHPFLSFSAWLVSRGFFCYRQNVLQLMAVNLLLILFAVISPSPKWFQKFLRTVAQRVLRMLVSPGTWTRSTKEYPKSLHLTRCRLQNNFFIIVCENARKLNIIADIDKISFWVIRMFF